MCAESSNSVLRSKNVSCMKEFTWDKLLDEMKLHAPMLLSIAIIIHYFVYNVYRNQPPAVRVTRGSGAWDRDRHNIGTRYAHAENRNGD